jgi:hypothetical protein
MGEWFCVSDDGPSGGGEGRQTGCTMVCTHHAAAYAAAVAPLIRQACRVLPCWVRAMYECTLHVCFSPHPPGGG